LRLNIITAKTAIAAIPTTGEYANAARAMIKKSATIMEDPLMLDGICNDPIATAVATIAKMTDITASTGFISILYSGKK
jgi:hypothetical protein